jgi:hypothetical protein
MEKYVQKHAKHSFFQSLDNIISGRSIFFGHVDLRGESHPGRRSLLIVDTSVLVDNSDLILSLLHGQIKLEHYFS